MRPLTAPSGIFASSVNGVASSARPGVVSMRFPKTNKNVSRFIGTIAENSGRNGPRVFFSSRDCSSAGDKPRGGSALFGIDLVKCSSQPFRKFLRVVIRPEVHEEEARLLAEHMTVQRRYLDSILLQRLDHGIYLRRGQDKI